MLLNNKYEVLTPTGWQDFDGVAYSPKKVVEVKTTTGLTRTSDTHRVIVDGAEVRALALNPGTVLAPGIEVISSLLTDSVDVLYDLVNVAGGNLYIADGFVHHNCEFQGSSGTLISGTKLQQLAFGEPVHQDEWLTVYAKPDPERRYVATADISEGVERDFSVCTVFDVTEKPFRIAAVYRSNIVPPSVFTEVLFRLGTQYNKALMIPETNSMGKQVAYDLWYEYDYDAVLRTVNKETGHVINYGHGSELGIRTTKPTKRLGCSSLKSLIETDLLIVQDYQAITELGTFISNGSSWSAANDKCDDVVMTLVIFAWFTQQRYFEEYMTDSINSVFRKAYEDEQYGLCSVFLSDGIAINEDDPNIDYSLINRSSTPLL